MELDIHFPPPLLDKICYVKIYCVQVNLFPYLGRVRGIKSVLRDLNFQSKQMGRRENKTINMEGRVQFDLLQVSFNSMNLLL